MARSGTVSIGDVGEFGFLGRLLPRLGGGRNVEVGPGDDCAVVRISGRKLLVTTDTLVEGVHFQVPWMTPAQLGRKAFLVNASDIAAMGGRPRFCLVSVGAPAELSSDFLLAVHRGLATAAREVGACVVGGNLTRASGLFLSVTLLGDPPSRPVLRCRARPGHGLYVTGTLGEAALGLAMLRENERPAGRAVRRFREPVPRLRAGELLARPGYASAMIDVSDGLVQDLGHLCRASGVGAVVEAHRIPMTAQVRRRGMALALSGGEDYELLCAVPPSSHRRVEKIAKMLGCRITSIGRCLPSRDGVRVVDEMGRTLPMDGMGFDHFAGGEAT